MGPEFRKSPLVSRQWTRSLCQDVILGVTNARDQMYHLRSASAVEPARHRLLFWGIDFRDHGTS